MNERDNLLASIADTIKDYRKSEIPEPTPDHVDRWVKQFDSAAQVPILRELVHVLDQTYFSKADIKQFLGGLVKNEKLVGDRPLRYWRKVNFLDIQQNGHSQKEMLALYSEILKDSFDISINECGAVDGDFIYLDDVIFSGTTIRNDLIQWVEQDAPKEAQLHVIVLAFYTGSEWVFREPIKKAINDSKKIIKIKKWRIFELENQKINKNVSEVLWPVEIPPDPIVQAYVDSEERFPFKERKPNGKTAHNIFSSEDGRQVLEQQLLMAGVKIRSFCKNPAPILRPLGFSQFGLGFGSTIVTYRNCPNNTPLALWWGDPEAPANHPFSRWYPLLPRKTYNKEVDLDDFPF